MRMIRAIKIIFLSIIFLSWNIVVAQDQCKPVGWATQNGGVTGGGNATAITVSTYADLKAALTSTSVKVVYISGVITFPLNGRIEIKSQSGKTIIGLAGSRLISVDMTSSGSGILYVKNTTNIIIRNVTFEGPGAYDVDGNDNLTFDNVQNAWVDHCDFQDALDGNFDIKNATDYLAVTWCKFQYLKPPKAGGSGGSNDHRFSDLIGSSDSDTGDAGKLRITFQYCWWAQGCVERMPRVRFGKLHIANCFYNSTVSNTCIRAGYEADLLIESNVFIGVTNPIDLYQNNFTAVTANNNIFTKTTGGTVGSGTAFTPPYSLTIVPASTVQSLVTNTSCGSGATMDSPTQCGCGTTANKIPTVSITAPVNASKTCIGATITITATAADSDGSISKVDFYNGTTLLGTDNTTPYTYSYTPTTVSTLSLNAIATDNSNATGTSSIVSVTINALPTATMTSPSTSFCAGGSVALSANAGTGLTYQWSNASGTISGATTGTYTATVASTYTVKVTNSSSCSATSTATSITVSSAPTATITSPSTSFCAGGSVALSANAGTGLTYQWSNASGTISGATTGTYTATVASTYTVKVTNSNACSATSTATTITVNSAPTATITSPSTSFCAGGSVALSANSGNGLTYQWSNASGTISGATTGTYTATVASTYTVKVTNSNACSATSTATTITVSSAPTATITSPSTSFCAGGSVLLTASAGSSYKWMNGTTQVGTEASYIVTRAGSYSVEVTNEGNCKATSSVTTITVNAAPAAPSILTSQITYCEAAIASQLSATGIGLLWYTVSAGGAGSTTAPTPLTSVAGLTNYYVSQTTTGCDNESPRSMISITVIASPIATITAGSSTAIPQGGNVVLTASVGSSYTWFKGTNQVGTEATYTATEAGAYTVEVTNTNNCSATSSATNVTINTNQPSMITITSPTNSSQVQGAITITATVTDPDGSIVLVEYLDGNTVIGTSTSAPYSFVWNTPTAGDHEITVRVTDSNGGITRSAPIMVTSEATATGLLSNNPNSLDGVVYPNPANGAVFIDSDSDLSDASFTLIDVLGNEHTIPQTATGLGAQIDVSNLSSGTYVLIIKKDDSVMRKKIAVMK
jgi:pectate lyase